MAFKSRRGATARRGLVVPEPAVADAHDGNDACVVIRKERAPRRTRPAARSTVTDDDERPALIASTSSGLYANGGLDQLRKEQTRITNTYSDFERMQVDGEAGDHPIRIPTDDSIAEAKRKRQQLRASSSSAPPSYIPLRGSSSAEPIAVAGGVYGPGSGESALVRDDDDDEVPDLLEAPPKVSVVDNVMIEEDDDADDVVGAAVSGATMTISEAEIHMMLVTRLEECRAANAAATRESTQIAAQLDAVRSEYESLSGQIDDAERKYIGLQDLFSTVSSLLECASGKAPVIDQLWNEYGDVRPRLAKDHGPLRTPSRHTERAIMVANGDADAQREALAYQAMMEIGARARDVFADVVDRFSSVEAVLEIFADWRSSYPEEYESAYCDLSLPRLLAPYLKLILISSGATDPERFAPLLTASAKIRQFSPSVMDALDSALIRPFFNGR